MEMQVFSGIHKWKRGRNSLLPLAKAGFSTFLRSLLLLSFFFKLLFLYLGTVHNQARTDAVEAR
jgi:hypothetical protein